MIDCSMDPRRNRYAKDALTAERTSRKPPNHTGLPRSVANARHRKTLMWAEIQLLRGEVEELRRLVGALEERVECGRMAS